MNMHLRTYHLWQKNFIELCEKIEIENLHLKLVIGLCIPGNLPIRTQLNHKVGFQLSFFMQKQ